MEDSDNQTVGFNKRRAEGRDKSDNPNRNLQLKVRKLNPTNTIRKLEDLDMQFLDCRSTTSVIWEAFEGNRETDKDYLAPGSPNNIVGLNKSMVNTESTLFARGSRMQSFWKRPGIPVDNAMAFALFRTLQKVLSEAGLEALISVPVVHCPRAFGVVSKAAERINSVGKMIPGWKILYSGDTLPRIG